VGILRIEPNTPSAALGLAPLAQRFGNGWLGQTVAGRCQDMESVDYSSPPAHEGIRQSNDTAVGEAIIVEEANLVGEGV
jgi:hypothetical protein